MIDRMDGVVIAVRDASRAADTFETIFDAKRSEPMDSRLLNARLTGLHAGTSHILLAEAAGDGPVADHLGRWGEGLLAVVLATPEPDAVRDRLVSRGVPHEAGQVAVHVPPEALHGLRTFVMPVHEHAPTGLVSFLYEVTHLVDDWAGAARTWADTFDLNAEGFCPISSDGYGYEGTLTMFDAPHRLDRIEVVHPHDTTKAMGRFHARRGQGPYMFFAESPDVAGIAARLQTIGGRFAGEGSERQSIFIHPSAAHGVLIGVSPTNLAWRWSGRPEAADMTS